MAVGEWGDRQSFIQNFRASSHCPSHLGMLIALRSQRLPGNWIPYPEADQLYPVIEMQVWGNLGTDPGLASISCLKLLNRI